MVLLGTTCCCSLLLLHPARCTCLQPRATMGNCIGGEKNVAGNNSNVNNSASGGGKVPVVLSSKKSLKHTHSSPPLNTRLAPNVTCILSGVVSCHVMQDEIIETQGSVLPPVDTSLALTNSVLGGSHAQDVSEVYDVGKVLGAGQFGTTRLAVHKTTGKRFAIKSINKARLAGMEDIACVKRELQVMHHVSGHPAVVSLKEAFEDQCVTHCCAIFALRPLFLIPYLSVSQSSRMHSRHHHVPMSNRHVGPIRVIAA